MDSIAFIICFRFNITPIPASSLTLQYFAWTRANEYPITPIRHSYLATIHLMHIENGFPDLTTDESLNLLCRGICRQQSSSRLPITINLLRTLKSQLCSSQMCSSQMSLLEQRLLWTVFIVIPWLPPCK